MEQINWYDVIKAADEIFFFCFMVFTCYLFIFAFFSFKGQRKRYPKTSKKHRYVVFFPIKGFDAVVVDSIKSFLEQAYSREYFELVVVYDKLTPMALQTLKSMSVILLENPDGWQSRARMLEYAIQQLNNTTYDAALIMKPGDTIDKNYLEEINDVYHAGGMVIQTHVVAKKLKTNTAILNAVSEEINNAIFRRGHVLLGFSASLIGSGMVFNYEWLKKNLPKIKRYHGLTKQLESLLLKQGLFIEYLEHVHTYEEKVKNIADFDKQRHNWYAIKRYSLRKSLKHFPKALFVGNFDYCDKIFQWIMPSRILMLVFIFFIALLLSFFNWALAIKWWGLLFFLALTFSIATPGKFVRFRTVWALITLPIISLSILKNLLFSRKKNG